MEKIYSKAGSDVLLAIVVPFQDFKEKRTEIVPATEFIQGAVMRLNEGTSFRPHKHIWKPFHSDYSSYETKAQECWIVLRGVIRVAIYDLDDVLLTTITLTEGSAIFLLHGGHSFECIEDHTCLWELKTGPYEGQANDKIFIDEKS